METNETDLEKFLGWSDQAQDRSSSEIYLAAETHLARKYGYVEPDGIYDENGFWYPSDIAEQCPICRKVRMPSFKNPKSLFNHYNSLTHICIAIGVEERLVMDALNEMEKWVRFKYDRLFLLDHCISDVELFVYTPQIAANITGANHQPKSFLKNGELTSDNWQAFYIKNRLYDFIRCLYAFSPVPCLEVLGLAFDLEKFLFVSTDINEYCTTLDLLLNQYEKFLAGLGLQRTKYT